MAPEKKANKPQGVISRQKSFFILGFLILIIGTIVYRNFRMNQNLQGNVFGNEEEIITTEEVSPVYETAEDCRNDGGSWVYRGEFVCIKAFPDAGKSCTDSSECTGKCIARGDETNFTGHCQKNDDPTGCSQEVIGGELGLEVCQ